jgi:hypothetical protein
MLLGRVFPVPPRQSGIELSEAYVLPIDEYGAD